MKKKRDRLSKSSVPSLLTLTEDLDYYDCENFIFESASAKYDLFSHWIGHLDYVKIKMAGYKDIYKIRDLEKTKEIVIESLRKAKFGAQANKLEKTITEEEFDAEIIRQYTNETNLYSEVNSLLRKGHHREDIGLNHLIPWILQLNSAIRKLPEFTNTAYRGSEMKEVDIKKYTVGKIFVWSSFVSFSKSEDECYEGNVIFEMTPKSSFATRDKRAPRDISIYSEFKEEQEVIMPICGGYKVEQIIKENDKTRIICAIYDHY